MQFKLTLSLVMLHAAIVFSMVHTLTDYILSSSSVTCSLRLCYLPFLTLIEIYLPRSPYPRKGLALDTLCQKTVHKPAVRQHEKFGQAQCTDNLKKQLSALGHMVKTCTTDNMTQNFAFHHLNKRAQKLSNVGYKR